MIYSLRTPHGPEVWVNHKLAETIETAFKEVLGTDTPNYYYIACDAKNPEEGCDGRHPIVWLGPIGVINYIQKAQMRVRLRNSAPVLCVTNCRNKAELEAMQNDISLREERRDYWIGDCSRRGTMACGDELFIYLWNRIWSKATKGSKTKRNSWG